MNKAWFDRLEEEVSRLSAIHEELAAPLVELMEQRRNTIAMIGRYDELAARLWKDHGGCESALTEAEQDEIAGLRRWIWEVRPLGGPPEPGSLQARIEAFLNDYLPKGE